MLLGEQAVPIAKRLLTKAPVVAYLKTPECAGQVLGPQALDQTLAKTLKTRHEPAQPPPNPGSGRGPAAKFPSR
ncbi:hypothetical protein ACRAWD_30140 [Caulobacter segnis]